MSSQNCPAHVARSCETHLGDIRHLNQLEPALRSLLLEVLLQIACPLERSNCPAHTIASFEEFTHDPMSNVAVGTSDEDLVVPGDDGHSGRRIWQGTLWMGGLVEAFRRIVSGKMDVARD